MNRTTVTAKKAVIKKTLLIACSFISDESAGLLETAGLSDVLMVDCPISASVKKKNFG
jgi:3-hydroxyisobutyrate dehydrogenase-like beta-hydroxyacid dehydrogenase